MNLYFAGTHHHDPVGRVRLKQWLEHIKANHDNAPAFIAVESTEDQYRDKNEHRNKYRKWLEPSPHYKCLLPDVLNDVVLSLGYEGDCHQELFPDSYTLWLNNHLTERDAIEEYATRSYFRLLEYFVCEETPIDSIGISEQVWEKHFELRIKKGTSVEKDFHNKEWAKTITEEIKKHKDGWAIIIVGADHTIDIEGSVFSLLKKSEGIRKTEVNVLCPESLQSSYEAYVLLMKARAS